MTWRNQSACTEYGRIALAPTLEIAWLLLCAAAAFQGVVVPMCVIVGGAKSGGKGEERKELMDIRLNFDLR